MCRQAERIKSILGMSTGVNSLGKTEYNHWRKRDQERDRLSYQKDHLFGY